MAKTEPRWLNTTDRYARLHEIDRLDPEREYREITQLFYADFQSTMVAKPLNGFLMNLAAPTISKVLGSTGELEHRVEKRIVDTVLLASTVMQHGFTGEGRDAARRVNAMHRKYEIRPMDFLAVGAEEVVGSIELAERYGWRPVTAKEREALNQYYSHQARAFGSPNPLPATYTETKAFFDGYLEHELGYEPRNEKLAGRVIEWVGKLAPAPVRPLFRRILLAQLDDRIARACGIRPASTPMKWGAHKVLKRLAAQDPLPDNTPNHLEVLARQVYPDGYRVATLGTHLD